LNFEEMSMQSLWTRAALCAVLMPILAATPGFSGCQAADKQGSSGVLATVDGKAITEADVRKSAPGDFESLEHEYAQKRYDLLQSNLDKLIQQRLVAAEAARRGSTEEDVLASVEPQPVTDADVDLFYQQNQGRIRGTKEQMAPQIREYLEQRNQDDAQKAFVDELRKKHPVDVRLEPLRVDVAATGPSLGPANAPVTIVEFADFQCPYCAKIEPALKKAKEMYGDEVRLVYRHYPLPMHSNAERAAQASVCADEQGKFWEMHDAMFANQHALAADQLKATAAGLGLDAETFNSCLDSGRAAEQVAADTAAGNAAGVSGTPALFVNGRFISGAVPLEQITTVVDDELRRRGVKRAEN
jgi:protein-disulfide isomerase